MKFRPPSPWHGQYVGNNRYESQPAYERAGFLFSPSEKHTQLETEVVNVELSSLQEEGGGRGR